MRRRLLGKLLKTIPSWKCNWSVTREKLYKEKSAACVCMTVKIQASWRESNMFGLWLQQQQQIVGQERWPACEISVSRAGERLHPHSLSLSHGWQSAAGILLKAAAQSLQCSCCLWSVLVRDSGHFLPLQKSGDLTVFIGFILPLRR